MKKKKAAVLTVFILILSMVLTGCGVADSFQYIAHKIAVAITNGEIDNDSDDNDDDDDNGGSGSHGSNGSNVAAAFLEDQYEVMIANQTKWFVGNRIDTDRFLVGYGVTDLDNDGFIEIVRVIDDNNDFSTESAVFEVNEDCDGINEIKIEYNGHAMPDIGSLYSAYEFKDNFYYNCYCYQYNFTDSINYVDYYLVYMEDNVIHCEVIKSECTDYNTYEVSYYNGDGNEIDEDEYDRLDVDWLKNGGDYISRSICMQECSDISRPYGEVTDTDLYYFLEHGYKTFMDFAWTMGIYYGELTVYTDPDSAEYKALEDVVVLNPDASGVHVRFTSNLDEYFDVIEGYWSDELEGFMYDGYVWNEMYFNRAYELILDIDGSEDCMQMVRYGFKSIPVNEENFGKQNGTYTIKDDDYRAKTVSEEDRLVKALGIVAYELYKCGSEDAFADDDELYCKTMAELVTYLYGFEEDTFNLPDVYRDKLNDTFFAWNWSASYLQPLYEGEYMSYHYGSDDCDVLSDPYVKTWYPDGEIEHWEIQWTDYSEAMNADMDVVIEEIYSGIPYQISYIFHGGAGKNDASITFGMSSESTGAFGYTAYYLTINK
ncbi:MAG: hypothetical protein MJ104_03675 [Lachnospiraceae bacterium]|nr:hypothetical protein [Lachnospiraceae bacterium]